MYLDVDKQLTFTKKIDFRNQSINL